MLGGRSAGEQLSSIPETRQSGFHLSYTVSNRHRVSMPVCAAAEQAGHLVRSVEGVSIVLSEGCIKRKAQRQIGVGDEVAAIGDEIGMAVLDCLDAALPLVAACRHECALQMDANVRPQALTLALALGPSASPPNR